MLPYAGAGDQIAGRRPININLGGSFRAITRLDLSAADLRDAAARTREAKAARRMLAIGLVLEGWSRESAAEACAMDRQTLRDWVHRYNEPQGINSHAPGPS